MDHLIDLIDAIDLRIHRLLARRGVLDDVGEGHAAHGWREEEPVLAGIAAASVQGGGRWVSGPVRW